LRWNGASLYVCTVISEPSSYDALPSTPWANTQNFRL
jgi:hypothetical protein